MIIQATFFALVSTLLHVVMPNESHTKYQRQVKHLKNTGDQYSSSEIPYPLRRHAFHEETDNLTTNRPYSNMSSGNWDNSHINNRRDYKSVNFVPRSKPKKCIKGLCEDSDDYPSDYIRRLLNDRPDINNFFSSEELTPEIINRLGDDDAEHTLCETKGHTTYPKTAKNVKNVEKFIVNVEGYKQGLVFETCLEEATCQFSELFPNDYEIGCKQRYVIRRLMALNETGTPVFDSFEIPSCCVCTYKKKKN